jgi:hypothetical protein
LAGGLAGAFAGAGSLVWAHQAGTNPKSNAAANFRKQFIPNGVSYIFESA